MVKAALKFFLAIIFLAGVITPAHAQEKPVIYPQLGSNEPIGGVTFSDDGRHIISYGY